MRVSLGQSPRSRLRSLRSLRAPLAMRLLAAVALLASCGDQYGGVTANLVFEQQPGIKRQGLRAEAVPMIIDRLQIVALADGSTLTDFLGNAVQTNLVANPAEGEEQLLYEGGEWELSRVPAGENRSLVANAYLGTSVDPRVAGQVAFRGRLDGITVMPGQVENVGTIQLRSTGIKIPEVDTDPPAAPNPVTVEPLAQGQALRATFGRPSGAEGYVLAVTASVGIAAPAIAQGSSFQPGDELAPGLIVHTVWAFAAPQIIDIEDLRDGIAYTVFVYAYDTDLDGAPLNYSGAASDSDIPRDTLKPGAVLNLAVGPANDGAAIVFNEPTEDDLIAEAGAVATYEVRASADRAMLMDPDTFVELPAVMPPVPVAPGQLLSFSRTFLMLRVLAGRPFYVGVRARDASANVGDIVTAEFTATGTAPPSIDRVDPEIAIAGREITVRGDNFGVVPGMVTLTTTGTSADTFTLPVTRWDNASAVVTVPRSARTGDLMLVRPDGQRAMDHLPIVLRVDGAIDDYQPPFEVVGATSFNGATVISAIYREAGEFSNFESAVERVVGMTPEATAFAPMTIDPHSTAVAGTYSPAYDRFMFVASTEALTMSTLFVSSSTLTPDPQRRPNGVNAGGADRVSTVFLDGGANGRYPALLAFTIGGTIRTATVSDVLLQPFTAFYALSSTVTPFDRVTLQRNAVGEILMAHRAQIDATRHQLWLRFNDQNGSPDGFVLEPSGFVVPEVGENFEIISVPRGATEEFVIAYEVVQNGKVDVHLLPFDTFGSWLGYAPFPVIVADRRLEDVGLVFREGSVWLAVLTSSPAGNFSTELAYTEVPYDALTQFTPRGSHPGAILDVAPDGTRGRVACKPLPQLNCPIVWSGDDDVRVLFLRR
jgi:hypothetical protein